VGIWTQQERVENFRMNPVAGHLVWPPGDYPGSSACALLAGKNDRLTRVDPMLALIPDWQGFLQPTPDDTVETLYRHEGTVRRLGREGLSKNWRPRFPGLCVHKNLARRENPARGELDKLSPEFLRNSSTVHHGYSHDRKRI